MAGWGESTRHSTGLGAQLACCYGPEAKVRYELDRTHLSLPTLRACLPGWARGGRKGQGHALQVCSVSEHDAKLAPSSSIGRGIFFGRFLGEARIYALQVKCGSDPDAAMDVLVDIRITKLRAPEM
jgi:hypothetical protein